MKNKIKGGKADYKTIEDIAKKHNVSVSSVKNELEKGMKVEKEHTNNEGTAKEIAMDHLFEFPDYYTRLNKMEKQAEKKKPAETKESMGADASGSFEAPLSGTILKKDIHKLSNWPGKQKEVKEITGAAVSAGAVYDAPPKGLGSKDPLKIDNPGASKTGTITASKEGIGYKNKNMKYIPGGKFVDVKKECTLGGAGGGKSKACNQGNQGNLNFYESQELQMAINEASKKYGIPRQEVENIVLKRLLSEALPKSFFDEPGNLKALKSWSDKGPKTKYRIITSEPLDIVTDDDVDISRLKVIFYRYDVNFKIEKFEK